MHTSSTRTVYSLQTADSRKKCILRIGSRNWDAATLIDDMKYRNKQNAYPGHVCDSRCSFNFNGPATEWKVRCYSTIKHQNMSRTSLSISAAALPVALRAPLEPEPKSTTPMKSVTSAISRSRACFMAHAFSSCAAVAGQSG